MESTATGEIFTNVVRRGPRRVPRDPNCYRNKKFTPHSSHDTYFINYHAILLPLFGLRRSLTRWCSFAPAKTRTAATAEFFNGLKRGRTSALHAFNSVIEQSPLWFCFYLFCFSWGRFNLCRWRGARICTDTDGPPRKRWIQNGV